uniref:Ovule protein n=1 Tax=Strongyloides venezuelensis TaxID=75913 RepID=A0A0K0G3D4_STRVS
MFWTTIVQVVLKKHPFLGSFLHNCVTQLTLLKVNEIKYFISHSKGIIPEWCGSLMILDMIYNWPSYVSKSGDHFEKTS